MRKMHVSHSRTQTQQEIQNLHFNDAARVANVEHLASKLVSKVGDGLQVLVLVAQSLGSSELAGVEVLSCLLQ